jgi:gliding motility-associated-like protein
MTASANADIFVPTFDPITLNTSVDTSNPCPYIPYTFFVEANGGAGDYTYQWSDNQGNLLGNGKTQYVKPAVSTTYYIVVTDRCGESENDSVTVTITSPPLVADVLGDTTICFGDSALFTATATGGWGAHYFFWPATGDTTATIWVNPRHTETVTVNVEDDCHTFYVSAVGEVKVVRPIANFVVSSHTMYEDLPITFHNTTYGGTHYQWEFGDGNTSTLVNPNNTYDVPGTYYITLHAQNDIGCRDSITKPITIVPEFYVYIPNSFTPNGDGLNDFFAVSTVNVVDFEILIFDRWGELIFQSKDKRFQWDGKYNNEIIEDGVYVYKVHYTSVNGDDVHNIGHVSLLR